MVRVENTVMINAKLEKVFAVVVDFERYPEFIPTYQQVSVLERIGQEMIIERVGLARGKPVKWKSRVRVEENRSITAEQLEGPLKGMQICWSFQEVSGGTRIVLIHEFEYQLPLVGHLVGKWLVSKVIRKMAQDTLEGIKKRVEGQRC